MNSSIEKLYSIAKYQENNFDIVKKQLPSNIGLMTFNALYSHIYNNMKDGNGLSDVDISETLDYVVALDQQDLFLGLIAYLVL